MTLLEALKINPNGFKLDGITYVFVQYPWEKTAWPRCNVGHWSEQTFDIKYKNRKDFEALDERT